jgi:AraC-like DNA-binding protein
MSARTATRDCAAHTSSIAFESPRREAPSTVTAKTSRTYGPRLAADAAFECEQRRSAEPEHAIGGYRESPPPADLAFGVEALWTHEAAPARPTIHRVVPDPAVSLCFTGVRDADGPGSSRLLLIGPVAHARMFTPGPGSHMTAVRIKLAWCRALLGVAPREHEDAEHPYALALPELGGPLEDRLARTRTPADVLRILVEFLRGRAGAAQAARHGSGVPAPPLVRAGMHMLRAGAGQLRPGALSLPLGVTDRHLRRVIIAETGISPRRFARVQRFHALLRDADRDANPGWAALAARHGYADQSHLIRELQDLAGVTPAQLIAERRSEPSAVSDADAARAVGATG